jgi:hypothetical protein
MKNQKLAVTIAVLSLMLLLTGCTSEQTNPTPNDKSLTTGTLAITPAQDVPSEKVLSEADQSAYGGAMQLNDVAYCDKIGDSVYKSQCKIDLSNAVALNEALTKSDASLCAKLSTKDKQDSCKIQVEVAQKDQQNLLTQQKQQSEQLSLYNEMYSKKDFTNCDKLILPDLLAACRGSGLVMEALATKDIKICDKGIDDAEQQNCRKSYQDSVSLSTRTNPPVSAP